LVDPAERERVLVWHPHVVPEDGCSFGLAAASLSPRRDRNDLARLVPKASRPKTRPEGSKGKDDNDESQRQRPLSEHFVQHSVSLITEQNSISIAALFSRKSPNAALVACKGRLRGRDVDFIAPAAEREGVWAAQPFLVARHISAGAA